MIIDSLRKDFYRFVCEVLAQYAAFPVKDKLSVSHYYQNYLWGQGFENVKLACELGLINVLQDKLADRMLEVRRRFSAMWKEAATEQQKEKLVKFIVNFHRIGNTLA